MVEGQRYEGSVKSWKEPWGWISCADVGADLFAHIQDVVVGTLGKDVSVSFELGTDAKSGKPRALRIEALDIALEAGPDGVRHTGNIKSWKEAWGWIESPEIDADIFGHKEDIVNADKMTSIEKGAKVIFDLGTDDKSGKPRAKRIELVDKAQKLTGEIASWKDQWGWIRSDQVDGGDVFAHSDDLVTIVQVGVKVSFELGTDAKSGKRRARNIASMEGKGGGKGGKGGKDKGKGHHGGHFEMMPPPHYDMGGYGGFGKGDYGKGDFGKGDYGKGYGGMPMMDYSGKANPFGGKGSMMDFYGGKGGPPPMMQYGGKGGLPGPQAFIGQKLEGRILSHKDPWGWISSPLFGGDLFAHSEDMKFPGDAFPPVGSQVFFTPGTDNKGRMRALQISTGNKGGGGGGGGGKKRKADNGAPKERAGEADFEQLEGSVIEGEVASWKSPWGWIKSESFAGDLFAHKEDVQSGEDLAPGSQVFFMVARDQKSGRWRARQINDGEGGGEKRQRK